MENKSEHITRLINRYFLGEITDEEAGELTSWLNASSDNVTQFDEAKKQWQGVENNPLTEANWLAVKSKIRRFNALDQVIDVKPRKRFLIWQAASVALFILVLGLGSLLLRNQTKQVINSKTIVYETPRGQRSKIILGDSTVVWLNAESKLQLEEFNDKKRMVTLSGQAHFEVTKNENAPFVVQTRDYDVTVLGTVFDVMAYSDMNRTVTTLLEGKVRVNRGTGSYDLAPGQQAIWGTEGLKIESVKDIERVEAWVNNDFYFDDVPLDELLIRLGRWYDVTFEYDPADLNELRFSGVFKNEETVWQVLNTIKLYIPIKYEKTDLRKVKITRMK